MNRSDFRFLDHLRVRWSEVDMQKIVFNGHYLMYFDTAMADYWRALAIPYEDTMHQLGGDLYVKKASLEYHASAQYDDRLDVGLRCQRIGNSSIQFVGGIFCGDQLLITGELLYVYANPNTKTSMPVPQVLRETMLGFEEGQTVTTLETGHWSTLKDKAQPVRTQVFVQEQGIDPALEWDAEDAHCVHAVLCNHLGVAVATGRLLPSLQGVAKIGRMAVMRRLRETGLGRQVLLALVAQARQRGDAQVLLHAQQSARGFYDRLGFVPQGEPFEEAGIGHIAMVLNL
jgi:YbgC/YbaW family acyl-CoA thioester hydrolase